MLSLFLIFVRRKVSQKEACFITNDIKISYLNEHALQIFSQIIISAQFTSVPHIKIEILKHFILVPGSL